MSDNDQMVLNCRMSFGRISFKFKPVPNEEWAINMKQKEAIANGVVATVSRDDALVDFGACVTMVNPLELENGTIETFYHKNVFSKEDCGYIWTQLKKLGFKPNQDTLKAMKKRGLV
jgi:hypothetical protein